MEFISPKHIKLGRELSELDQFTLKFINTLKKHTPYVLVSGYVSIVLGRSRASEDVDVLLQHLNEQEFLALFNELTKNGFYCLNAEQAVDAFEYLEENAPIRFAQIGQVIPNMEVKIAKKPYELHALQEKITVELGKDTLFVSPLELQIAFKEIMLKSPKDMEDARHLRKVAEKYLDREKLKGYEMMLCAIR